MALEAAKVPGGGTSSPLPKALPQHFDGVSQDSAQLLRFGLQCCA